MRGLDAVVVILVGLTGCGRTGVWLPEQELDPEELCMRPEGTFATRVIAYEPTFSGGPPPESASYSDPRDALGRPDYVHDQARGAVALGQGGRLDLAFEACELVPGGDFEADLRVYEVGPAVESTIVSIQLTGPEAESWGDVLGAELDGWVEVGVIAGSVREVDIDARLGGIDSPGLRFGALRLVDDVRVGGWDGASPGADIDAVELLSHDLPSSSAG